MKVFVYTTVVETNGWNDVVLEETLGGTVGLLANSRALLGKEILLTAKELQTTGCGWASPDKQDPP